MHAWSSSSMLGIVLSAVGGQHCVSSVLGTSLVTHHKGVLTKMHTLIHATLLVRASVQHLTPHPSRIQLSSKDGNCSESKYRASEVPKELTSSGLS